MPLGTLVEYGMEQLQRDPDIRRIYSESSGLTHFLIHAERAAYRGAGGLSAVDLFGAQVPPA
ncbi:MAG: hypothetical protein R3C10_19930 [Pirellulales bacterium]